MVEIGSYDLHSRFSEVANFVCGNRLITLGTQALDDGPLNIVISEPLQEDLTRLDVGIERLMLYGREITAWDRESGVTYDSQIVAFEQGNIAVQKIQENGATLRFFLCQSGHPSSLRFLWMNEVPQFGSGQFVDVLTQRLRAGANALRAAKWIEGARSLRGVGIGLTPTGDDFLVGVMFGLHLVGRATGVDGQSVLSLMCNEALCGRDEPIINAMYQMARQARAFRSLKDLLEAIVLRGSDDVVRCARNVFSVGETSGTDLVAGLVWAIEKGGCGCQL